MVEEVAAKNHPSSAYIFFYQEQCNMHKENKNSKEDKMEMREVGKKWKMLAPEAKQKYAKLAKQSLKEYKERKKDDPPKAPKITFVTRTQLKAAYSVIEGLQPLQVQSVKDIGFGGLLRLQCTKLDRRLCEWLVERFDPVSLCLSVFGKKLMITPLDVNHILGLPCGGERVTLKGPLTEIHDFCVKHEVRVQGSFCLNKLKETLEGMKNNYDDNDFKVLFVLYMMGTVLCPTSEFGVNKRFLHALKDTSTISKLDWSQFVLEFLANGIKSYKEKGRNAIRGCLLFLMLFYLEHCTPAKDFSSRCEDRPSPRLSAWGDKEIRNRICWLNQKVEQKLNVIVEAGVGKRQRALNQGKEIDQNEPIGELTHRVRELTSVVEEVVVLMRKDKKSSKHKDRNVKEPSHMKTNEDKKGSKEAISDDVTSPVKIKKENDNTKPSPMKTNEDKGPKEPTLKASTKKLRRMAAHIRESLSSTAPPPTAHKNKTENKLRTSRFKETQPVKANAKEKPFTSYPPMSEPEKLITRYVFDQSLSVREQLCNLGMEHATRAEFLTLRQGVWISSSIINLVAVKKTLVQRDRDPNGIWPSWYLPTYFADYALGRGHDAISWVKQYSGNNKYTGIVKECERVR
ncbi:hypothetical protein Vadar_005115 [Vaccinium darrowii]|uniref:Uncharacterized protein n=1 Tax=Vaccinium darrowii TaxID=229202 RepID=A0ACB7WXX0_9ERIC|nr:hypothetical protein Vadar_005115 [Vaccinium darrowii]